MTLDSTHTTTDIADLVNGKEYEFGVASVDRFGNRSDFAVVVATPKFVGLVSARSSQNGSDQAVSTALFQSQSADQSGAADQNQITSSTTDQDGKIKGEATKQEGSRAAVTLAILLLAVAAGVGGYYGYEWWLSRQQSTPRSVEVIEKPKGTTKANTSSKGRGRPAGGRRRNGRW
jgi:hypothetical protein